MLGRFALHHHSPLVESPLNCSHIQLRMLAQTNLQLYRQLMRAGYDERSLAQVRSAYQLAQELFAGCFRPSEKPFVSHLIGAASAVAHWGEPVEMVIAGLLHSAYLYGDFGDGTRGMTETKRAIVRKRVGSAAEAIIARYSVADRSLQQVDRAVQVLLLADRCDEMLDAGVLFAPGKTGDPGRDQWPAQAAELVGAEAATMIEQLIHEVDQTTIPPSLQSESQSFVSRQRGVPELYFWNRLTYSRFKKWTRKTLRKEAA